MYPTVLLLSLLAHSTLTVCKAIPQSLKTCATQALRGSDAAQRIVTSQDETYTDARLGERIQFEQFPALIAYVKDAEEVAPLIECAKKGGVKAVPRNGGHSFSSFSALTDALIIDLGHLNYVTVSPDRSSAKVGAGIRLGALYITLNAYSTTFVGGICPTVGLSGLVGAGGFNMQMRALGVSSDHVLAAKVVTADGKTLIASPSSNPDLFWAIRGGGGGTFGILIELTLKLTQLPRSAMFAIAWNGTNDRFDVAKRFLEWAPAQPKELTSQVNVYRSTVQVLGWHLGGSAEELQALVDDSGLLDIGKPQATVSGDCNTDNSRLFGYTVEECIPDEQVDASILNVVPDPFGQYENSPQFSFDEKPASDTVATADPWPRYHRMAKSFFVQKDNLMSDDVLREVIDRIGQLDEASEVWGEWHAWNISGAGDNAFAWREQAYAHLEFQVHGSDDEATQKGYEKWFVDLEEYLRPELGVASYAGYMDSNITVDPLQSYYGDNVCRLVNVKKAYDPENFFANPQSIPTTYESC